MSEFYSFTDGEIWNLTFFTSVYSITYNRVQIVCGKSYRVDWPLCVGLKPRTDEQVFLDKFLDEFTYASV